jgi:hypothetical protein
MILPINREIQWPFGNVPSHWEVEVADSILGNFNEQEIALF